MADTLTLEQSIVDSAKRLHDSSDFSGVYAQIVQLQQADKNDAAKLKADMTRLNGRLHDIGVFKGFELTGADSDKHFTAVKDGKTVEMVASNVKDVFVPKLTSQTWLDGVGNVASSLGRGAWHEITHHYGRVAGSGALGFGIGVAATLLAPEAAVALGVVGLGIAGYQLITRAPKWYQDAKIVANPGAYSPTEARRAEFTIQGLGAGAVDMTAGMAGGIAGSKFANSRLFASIKEVVSKQPATAAAATEATEVASVQTTVKPEPAAVTGTAPASSQRFEIPRLTPRPDYESWQFSTTNDPKVWVRVLKPEVADGNIVVTDIYRGSLPKGSGGDLLAQALGDKGLLPTSSLTFKNIINTRMLQQVEAGMEPAKTVLGETGAKALEILKLKPVNYSFVWVEDKLSLVIKTIR